MRSDFYCIAALCAALLLPSLPAQAQNSSRNAPSARVDGPDRICMVVTETTMKRTINPQTGQLACLAAIQKTDANIAVAQALLTHCYNHSAKDPRELYGLVESAIQSGCADAGQLRELRADEQELASLPPPTMVPPPSPSPPQGMNPLQQLQQLQQQQPAAAW